jgi:hypothetical protein
MLSLFVTGAVSFWLIPKRPIHFLLFAAMVAVGIRLAGPEVRARFSTAFASEQARDESAQSRLDLWTDCVDAMLQEPFLGLGPNHWGLIAHRYGWPAGKEAHSLWFQTAAELGLPGITSLVLFYGLCVLRLRPFAKEKTPVPDPWLRYLARGVIAALIGFAVAAQFVTLLGLEAPYYITLIGAGILKVAAIPQVVAEPAPTAEAAPAAYARYAPAAP